MRLKRILAHLCYSRLRLRRTFSPARLHRIEAIIREVERNHHGEIRFAVEAALDLSALWRNQSARQRAIDVFSHLRIWDTEHNNGILIYLLMADRDVEIVADRGIHRHVGDDAWENICHDMETHLRNGDFETGIETGIRAIAAHLSRHYPASGKQRNEIPDAPIIL